MRHTIAFLAVLLAAILPVAARAQTTTFGADCSSSVIETNGGLTLQVNAAASSSSTNYYGCRANTPKYSGLWYFEVTATVPAGNGLAFGFGLGNNGTAQPVVGGMTVENWGNTVNSVFYDARNATFQWFNQASAAVPAMATGQTGAVAVDLSTDPPQIWVTQDVTGTGGYGGGPEWNDSTTASPLVPGTGSPTTGETGLDFIFPGQAYFPIFAGQTYQDRTTPSVTFNFGGSTFAGQVPSGYSSWDTAGGGAPTPGPTHPMTINVANAPAWQANTTYAQGDRVVAGPAWNGSAYTSGQALYLWALTGGYGGTSGTSSAAFNSCPSPANYGGGLLGNHPRQWLGGTHVSDGALTWTCLTPVDYTTFTAMADDSAQTWAVSAQYHELDYVMNGGNAYLDISGTDPCTSAASGGGPTGSSPTTTIADGTCTWVFQGSVPYSSEANRFPHQINYGWGVGAGTEISVYWNTTVNLWYGGRAAPAYQNGANGESDPILLANHHDFPGEWTPNCYHGNTGLNLVQMPNCAGSIVGWQTTLQPAPGDGFADNMAPGRTPFGYPNAAYGVEFYSSSAVTNGAPFPGSALTVSDADMNVFGLQFLSTQGAAMPTTFNGSADLHPPGNGYGDYEYFNRDIFYSGGGLGVVTVDASSVVANSTIVYAGTTAGCFGLWSKFNAAVVNTTFIGPGAGATNCTAIMTFEGSAIGFTTTPIYNNAIFGWANPYAYGVPNGLPTTAAGNSATDLPSSYTPPANFDIPGAPGNSYAAAMLPGVSLYSLPAASQFVDPTPGPGIDLRLLTTGSLYGGGTAFSYPLATNSTQTLASGPDIFGNPRSQGGRYDIGAYQVSLGCPSTAGAGCN